MVFQIGIAGKIMELHTLYDWTFQMCRAYIVEKAQPDYVVKTSLTDIEFERLQEGSDVQSDGYLESLAVYRKISEALLEDQTFLMHGSVIGIGDQAVMFTAPSGTGKTTLTQLWQRHIPEAYVVNGDKPLLRVDGEKTYVYGTPWCGKENENTNCSAVLKAICFLKRGDSNSIRKINAMQSVSMLMGQIYRPKDQEKMRKTVKLMSDLMKTVEFYHMTFQNYEDLLLMDGEAALLSYQTLFSIYQER